MKYLKDYSISHNIPPKKCCISYTWPSSFTEVDQHCKVLRLASDLKAAGVLVNLDLFLVDEHCDFTKCLVEWIEESDAVLMMGSPSYKKRSEDSSTSTHVEVKALFEKRKKDSEAVIPVLMGGRFAEGFPPGYIETIGARITDLENYYKEVPSIAFKMLNLHKEKEVFDKLLEYRKIADAIIASSNIGIEEVKKESQCARVEMQSMFWRAQLITHKVKFTKEQLEVLDARLVVCDTKIKLYSNKVMSESPLTQMFEDTSPGAARLADRLQDFIASNERVLLLHSPLGSGTRQGADYLVQVAWKEKGWIPVYIDLGKVKEGDKCVESTLQHYIKDFEADMIELARERYFFLLIIEGFDKCGMESNLYVKWNMAKWRGKAVFTCDSSYISSSPQANFYFMPSDGQQPNPQGLKVVSFASPQILSRQTINDDQTDVVAANETRRQDPTTKVATDPIEEKKKEYTKGYLLIQRDLVTPSFKNFLKYLRNGEPSVKVFISYAWPEDKSDCTALQERLVRIVEDMGEAGIDVLLDVLRLNMGTNVNEFMQNGIIESSAILWIGTPRLKQRINFTTQPPNPATFECLKIMEKAHHHSQCIQPLWFGGDDVSAAFPDGCGLDISNLLDFRQEQQYFKKLPLLVARILHLEHSPQFLANYTTFCNEIQLLDDSITEQAVWDRWAVSEANKQQESAKRIEELIQQIPNNYKRDQLEANEAELRILEGIIEHQRELIMDANSLKFKSLEFYIPLNGGTHPNSTIDQYFSVETRALDFLQPNNTSTSRLMLVMADAGAGKSMLGRYLERYLWQNWKSESGIPIFIALSQSANLFKGIVEAELLTRGFGESDIKNLRRRRMIFILDGFDEIPLFSMPNNGILGSNRLLEDWPLARFILTTRTQYLPELAKQMNTSYQQHLTQGLTAVEEIYLMSFNENQIKLFLDKFSSSPIAQWTSSQYWNRIIIIPGALQLARTPFILRLLVSALPRLSLLRKDGDNAVKKVDVYKAFTEQFSEREMWKQITQSTLRWEGDWMQRSHSLAEIIAQELFTKSVTQTSFLGNEVDSDVLRGCPIQKSADTLSFIHKSVQEYFTASYWIRKLNTGSQDELVSALGARLVTQETGVLEFVCQSYVPAQHQNLLLTLVYATQSSSTTISHSSTVTAAANAFTILNATRFNFSHQNFSVIKIPGANLDNLIAHQTVFRGADLRGVSLRQAWLLDADFQHCQLDSVQFGQYPGLKSRKLFAMVTEDDNLVAHEVGVIAWDAMVGLPKASDRVNFTKAVGFSCMHEGRPICKYVYKFQKQASGQEPMFVGYAFVSDPNIVSGDKVLIKLHDRILMNDMIRRTSNKEDGDEVADDDEESTYPDIEIVVPKDVTCVSYVGGKLLAGSTDHTVRMWNIATGKATTLRGHTGVVRCVAAGENKALASDNGEVLVWDAETGQRMGQPIIPNEECIDLYITGERILTRGRNIVDVWDVAQVQGDSRELSTNGHVGGVNGKIAQVVVHEGAIVSVGRDGLMCIWNLETGQLNKQINIKRAGVSDWCTCVAIDENGRMWVGGNGSITTCSLYKEDEGTIIGQSYITLGNMMWYQGRLVLTNNNLEVWEGDNMKMIHSLHSLPMNGNFEGMTGRQLEVAAYEYQIVDEKIVVNQGKHLTVWDINTGEKLLDTNLSLSPTATKAQGIALHNGNVVLGQTNGDIQVYNVNNGECLGEALKSHNRRVTHLSTYDDDRIVSVHSDGKVIMWDMNNRREVARINMYSTIQSIACRAPWVVLAVDRHVIRLECTKEGEEERMILRSCHPETCRLKVSGCQVEGATGLSDQNKLLIKQLNKPSRELQREAMRLQQLERKAKNREEREKEWIEKEITSTFCPQHRQERRKAEPTCVIL